MKRLEFFGNAVKGLCKDLQYKTAINRQGIIFCLIATFIWGFIAHAYIFLHSSFSHDSLAEFYPNGFFDWKVALGRVLVPFYATIARTAVTLPWLIGLLSLLYIGIAVFLVTKIFGIKSRMMMILTAGIFTVNRTVTATASTYIHDLDSDMLALLFSVFSVYLLKRCKKGFLFGMIPVGLSLALYQSYISVTVTLILMLFAMELFDGKAFKYVFQQGVKACAMLIGGGVFYFLLLKSIHFMLGTELASGGYNTLDTALVIPYSAAGCVHEMILRCIQVLPIYPSRFIAFANMLMFFLCGLFVLWKIFRKDGMKLKEKGLLLCLIALMPFGMNIVLPLTKFMSHDLMHFALYLVYFFVLLLAWQAKQYGWRCLSIVLSVLVFAVLWNDVQTANAVHLKKDLERQSNLALFARVVYDMEKYEGYIAGETPVVFAGNPASRFTKTEALQHTYHVTGSSSPSVLGAANIIYWRRYFELFLANPAVMADATVWKAMQKDSRVAEMPCYPAGGSIRMLDGILVVKVGETKKD